MKKELIIAFLLLSMVFIVPVFAYGETQGSYERKFVARVIFAEAGPSCSDNERELVASVMVGRIGRQGFDNGNLATMYEVASQPNAFSCINDPNNMNWQKSETPEKLSDEEKRIWDQCDSLAGGNFQQHYGPSGRPLVYYHDKSISKPSSWDNKYWYAVKELETDHFVFYSIVANNAAVARASNMVSSSYQGSNSMGKRIAVTSTATQGLNVRTGPGTSYQVITAESQGSTGTITNGPTFQDGYWWWQVNFDDGTTGWSIDDYLVQAVQPNPELVTPSYQGSNSMGERVASTATQGLNVRSGPGTNSQIKIAESQGSTGTITNGPTFQDGYWWWQVNFDDGTSGWSVDDWLRQVVQQSEPFTPAQTENCPYGNCSYWADHPR